MDGDDSRWCDVRALGVEGQGWHETEKPFDRFPARARAVVREPVWQLSRNSAGLCFRFRTRATTIRARWRFAADIPGMELRVPAMPHMPATGVSGLDLYARRGRGGWHWLGSGRPVQFPVSDAVLVNDLPPGPERECLLYLPLYSSVEQVELGVPAAAELIPVPPPSAKPVVFYGTSIVQGGCASRPGMVHTAILGRWLNVSVINLGFSGNGQMEPEIAALLAELDPAVYVLDALPNMTLAWVRERAEAFLLALRRAHPATPILLVGQARFCNLPFFPGSAPELAAKDREFRSVVRRLERAGQAGFSWLPGQALWGSDGEATVDGIHPTDLGFLRMAQALRQPLRRLLAPPAEP